MRCIPRSVPALSSAMSLAMKALLAALLLTALLLGGAARAQDAAGSAAAAPPTVAELRARLDRIPAVAETDSEVRGAIARINEISTLAEKFAASRATELNDLNARLGELGNAPPTGTEDRDVTQRRAALTKERNAVDADIRLARLVVVDAQQRGSDLVAQRRQLFEDQLTERAPSPLARQFWSDLAAAWPEDLERLRALVQIYRDSLGDALARDGSALLVSLALALILILPGNWLAERLLVKMTVRVLPAGRLRRSLLVIAIVTANVLLVALAVHSLYTTFEREVRLSAELHKLTLAAVQSSIFIAFVVGLGRALLANARPSWRLPPIPDELARKLAPFPWLTALTAVLVWAPTQINAAVDASFAAVVATHVVTALAHTALVGAMLWRLRTPRGAPPPAPDAHAAQAAPDGGTAADAPATPASAPADTKAAERPLWVATLRTAVLLVLVAIWVVLGLGFVALASFVAAQLTWTGIVIAAFYLFFKFANDFFLSLVSSRSPVGQRLQASFNLRPQLLDQAAVVLSGVARVGLAFYMVIALLAPLGTGPGEVVQRSGRFGSGLKIGEFQIVPGAILSALGVLVAGFIALRIFKRWLDDRYLPTTQLEAGMRSSITTLLGYVGGILVVALALSALGIGVNRIAWIASALSVGIGFGLQAIVQNFISGLILLAERPVKVGDWVVLGTTEGDVRRISVRATEIQLGDRSTVIVPNSEFITKSVRNMTLANAEGRVLIRLPMPLGSDAKKVRDIILAACNDHQGVLRAPAPSLTLEGIENGFLIFQAIAYVPSPRLAGGVRSDLLFEILDQLRAGDIPLATPTMIMAAPSSAAAPQAPTLATPTTLAPTPPPA